MQSWASASIRITVLKPHVSPEQAKDQIMGDFEKIATA